MLIRTIIFATAILALPSVTIAQPQNCNGTALDGVRGSTATKVLSDGTVMAIGKANINIDGYARAYHPENAKAGALIHLCNAGQVYLPDGTHYHGSVNNPTCTGRFMEAVAKIRVAGWDNPHVGLVRWYGILGRGKAQIGGHTVEGVTPVLQADESGFYVSPTAFFDTTIADNSVQNRYVNPLRIPAAVIPNQAALRSRDVVMGSFGVAYDKDSKHPVPFVVGDYGPAVGEATPALARSLAGLPITDDVTRATRFVGQVEKPRIVWMFFGTAGGKVSYDSKNEQLLISSAKDAYEKWGGDRRLALCVE